MSAASDKYENDVANYIRSLGIDAERPKVSSKWSDIVIHHPVKRPLKQSVWLEVKMSHTDNLGNTRVFFDGNEWGASLDPNGGGLSPLKQFCVNTLNNSSDAKKFVEDLRIFANMMEIKIPTTLGGLKDPKAVPLDVMKSFFKNRDRYILKTARMDMWKLVTDHYLRGKEAPAYYMQAGDDFYKIGNKNPLKLPGDVPMLSGTGEFKMRISTRSRFYEVQPEVKITDMPSSKYSLKPGTRKKNPFESLLQ